MPNILSPICQSVIMDYAKLSNLQVFAIKHHWIEILISLVFNICQKNMCLYLCSANKRKIKNLTVSFCFSIQHYEYISDISVF